MAKRISLEDQIPIAITMYPHADKKQNDLQGLCCDFLLGSCLLFYSADDDFFACIEEVTEKRPVGGSG
jgi:hypothetical protein